MNIMKINTKAFFKIKKLYLNVEASSEFLKYSWNTSNLSNSNCSLSMKNSKTLINLKKNHSTLYLVLNSYPKNFKKINFDEGIDISSYEKLEIGLFTHNINSNNIIKLLILEYDYSLARINLIRYPVNIFHTYTPSSNTKKIVLVIEVKGFGKSIIDGILLKGIKKASQNSLASPYTSLPSFNNKKSFYEQFKDFLLKLESEKNYFSSEAYKWKRRTLQLQEKQKEITSNIENNLCNVLHETLTKYANSLPTSNGTHFYKKLPYKIGIITDIYMYNFYKDTFNEVHYLSPDNYEEVLKNNSLDIILYVSCWKGLHNEEWKGVKFRSKPSKALNDILMYGKSNNIKLVFQSIEDPSNFEYFLPIAEKFDYIFTSDIDMIDVYKKRLGHDNVFYGEYGFNPLLNNPIASQRELIDGAFFAGSYPKRYEERCADMRIVFDSILNSQGSLVIADRNFDSSEESLQYPQKYNNNLIPPIEHETLQKVHKLFRFNLNFNSIKNSPSMCAMRVYELQAQGTIILSNYAKSVFNKFPAIRILPIEENLQYDFNFNKLYEYKLRIDSLREVMSNKTAFDVSAKMIENIGYKKISFHKNVAVLYIKDKNYKNIQKSFETQTYPHKILISIEDIKNSEAWENIKNKYNIEYFTWFNSNHEYQENYLSDMIHGYKYTNANYITKNSFFTKDKYHKNKEHEYTDFIKGKDKTLFRADKFSPLDFKTYKLDEDIKNLYGGYSIDPFELNYTLYMENSYKAVKDKENYKKLTVIIPIYNNGKFLKYKCLPSLMRNKIWNNMEILLIDDGSTDKETIILCKRLEREYENIKTYFYNDGGSGSASRPRNKGIELASTELLTFLDPDNEISPGGYDILVELYYEANKKEHDVHFISGYNIKVDKEVKKIAKHTSSRLSIISDFQKPYFMKGRFPTISTQAAVISTKLFRKNKDLRFVEKSAGQDTLFGWELLLKAKKGAFTSEAFLIYYADRSGSVTNVINSTYFEKKLILEREQVKILKEYGILDAYLKHHFDRFLNDWYLPKLELVPSSEYAKSYKILSEICHLYGKSLTDYIKKDKK